ncbi:hypothetical protein DVR12_24170 [Chitinophaga silvatica]|uniref:Baseplate J-like protein n=1 Tax=Chitinophaga silvatica TaxID=2282649 RepID=A0A3E1Y3Q5_9BACT|nr:hypothetical protein [Chitinophaga silvatica]RFS19330.1 hypothetical protein DVR12_24170 [Chitinophaga silvatica]
MEDLKSIYQALLYSDGIGQWDRLLPALEETYVQLEDRDPDQLLGFLYALSKEVAFYNSQGFKTGEWSGMFKSLLSGISSPSLLPYETLLNARAESKDVPAHLGLLLVYLSLLNKLKSNLNGVPRAHAAWYYNERLKFPSKALVPDKVQVVFELNKNLSPQLITANTPLDAGKTEDGLALIYNTTSDLIVNQGQVTSAYVLFVERVLGGNRFWKAAYDPTAITNSFLPFGGPQTPLAVTDRVMQPATAGLAVTSSLLELGGGQRTITLSILSSPYSGTAPSLTELTNLAITLTGEKGWVNLHIIQATIDTASGNRALLKLVLSLSEAIPPIIGHQQAIHKTSFPDGVPVLRIICNENTVTPDLLLNFRIAQVDIQTVVTGLKQLVVQNDEGLQSVNSPFQVFGSWPVIGSRFFIGSKECFGKNISQATLHFKWLNPPADFKQYYAGYSVVNWYSFAEYRWDVDMLLNGTFDNHTLQQGALMFGGVGKDSEAKVELLPAQLQKIFATVPTIDDVEVADLSSGYVSGIPKGFIRLTLATPEYADFSAFGHSNYTKAISAVTQAMIHNPAGNYTMPQVPYTPVLKEVAVDYTASGTIFPGNDAVLYHISPFGIEEINDTSTLLLPDLSANGYLYIGLNKLLPQQQVSVLFHAADNEVPPTGDDPLGYSDPVVNWSYLADGIWQRLRSDQLVLDTTQAFRQTGIIALQTGADASLTDPAMPQDLLWLRAELQEGLYRIPPIDGIYAQAVEAELDTSMIDQFPDAFANHLAAGLPPDSIHQMPTGNSAVKKVFQPYVSYGGRAAESTDSFITRMAERLRHRNRAVQGWDIERLILAAFPDIVKIKCLGASDTLNPGTTTAIIIPRVNIHQTLAKRLQPKANGYVLDNIANTLSSYLPAFANIEVYNPVYEELLADFKVKFISGYDPAYFLDQLNTDLIRYLSPWAFDESSRLHFDAAIYRSEIIYFIENLPYIDFVTDFKLFHLNAIDNGKSSIGKMKVGKDFSVSRKPMPNVGIMTIGDTFIVGTDWEVVVPSQPTAILVSVPRHAITVVDTSRSCNSVPLLGIGAMTINLDFIITKS